MADVAVVSMSATDANNIWASVWRKGSDPSRVLAITSDGGNHWTMNAQAPALASISMADSSHGWAIEGSTTIASGTEPGTRGLGLVLRTVDGGTSWTRTGAGAQSICAGDSDVAWGANGTTVLRTTDGGSTWSSKTLYPSGWYGSALIGCAGASVAWDLSLGGATMNQESYLASLTTDGGRIWTPLLHEGYFPLPPNVKDVKSQIDAESGPFSVVSASTAFFAGWCPACEAHPVSVTSTNDGGGSFLHTPIPIARQRRNEGVAYPIAISFPDAVHGWFLIGWWPTHQLWRTSDGGRTWVRLQFPA